MNRMKKEEIKKRNAFLADLDNKEIEFFEEIEERRRIYRKFRRSLHANLFPEEYDFMYDDHVDAKARARGENPMQESYQIRVNERRKKMGIEPPMSNGRVKYNDSSQYTTEVMKKLLTGDDLEIKEVIKSLREVSFNYKHFLQDVNSYGIDEHLKDKIKAGKIKAAEQRAKKKK